VQIHARSPGGSVPRIEATDDDLGGEQARTPREILDGHVNLRLN
jgi:hypothetical protein